MANEERGEVALVGESGEYTLALGMNALCDLQTKTGKSYGQVLQSIASDMAIFRDTVFLSLRRHHAKEFPNVSSVGDLIDRIGIAKVAAAIGRLIELNAGKDEDEPRPPSAQN